MLFCMLAVGCEPDRAAQAMYEKRPALVLALQAVGVNPDDQFELFFRAFKAEKTLELWAKNREDSSFMLVKTYPVCQASGQLGPKRREGDRQVPEGVYYINRFNPKSVFHLSLGLDYPNAADLVHCEPAHPGSDIFIHGGFQSIGCLAMTDDFIKEIYSLAALAKEAGQRRIPVHIFPARMTANKLAQLTSEHPEHTDFWHGLQPVFQYFESTRKLPRLSISTDGKYVLDESDAMEQLS